MLLDRMNPYVPFVFHDKSVYKMYFVFYVSGVLVVEAGQAVDMERNKIERRAEE